MDDPGVGGLLSRGEHPAIYRPDRLGLASLHRRWVVGADETWVGRAVGVFNQPVVNGMLLALGFAVAMLLMSRHSQEPAWRRWLAFVIAVACGYGLYLTHTRAAWLSGAVVLIIGALLAKGYRKGFIAALGITATIIAINWSVFTSSDREAGGVASVSEVDDRLNTAQTALWAAAQKPLAGWGIGRFPIVNTYHHQQWSPETPWIRGYAIVSHTNELGILAELGAIGLTLWICVLALVAYRLWDAYRTLPDDDLCGKPLAVTAIMAFAILFMQRADRRPPVLRLPDGHHLLARRNRDRLVRSP